MYDYHLHSIFSTDSYNNATMTNMCNGAISMGLSGICFTDHIDIDYPNSNEVFPLNDYFDAIKEIAIEYKNKLEVFTGIELGLQPHLKEENQSIAKYTEFDFILGSVHVVDSKEMYNGDFLEDKAEHIGILKYFNELKQCLLQDFDSLGHIDGVRRYLRSGEEVFSFTEYKNEVYEVLDILIKNNKGLELNTSAIRYGLSDFHPIKDILILYKNMGGKIITLGSDAHRPQDIAFEFKNALALLKNLGFKHYCIYKERKPIFLEM